MRTIPDAVSRLIDKFNSDRDHYRSIAYNEELCRVDFITPLFEALGWDMTNQAGYAAAYRDVIHEDANGVNTRGAEWLGAEQSTL